MSTRPLPTVPSRVMVAPMGGGPTTPQLVAAVGDAGGLGFLAGGYKTADQVAEEIRVVRILSSAPFAVNLFVPIALAPEQAARVPAYARALEVRARHLEAAVGEPIHGDDHFAAKVAVVLAERPHAVSFTFGLPEVDVIDRLHRAEVCVLVTVTSTAEARQAASAGVDGLVVQGWEAGAHRGGFDDLDGDEQMGSLPLLRLIHRQVDLPLVAAGGLGDGAGVAAVLVAGACAAMLGTAFLRCPEAGTSAVHKAALADPHATVVTRAFTGRRARALKNAFTDTYGGLAPGAYPEVHYVTAPLRAAARQRGEIDDIHLWGGEAHELAQPIPAGELVRQLVEGAREALAQALRPAAG